MTGMGVILFYTLQRLLCLVTVGVCVAGFDCMNTGEREEEREKGRNGMYGSHGEKETGLCLCFNVLVASILLLLFLEYVIIL